MLNFGEVVVIWLLFTLEFETIIFKNMPRIRDLNFNEEFIIFKKLVQVPVVLSDYDSNWKTMQEEISPLFKSYLQ